MRPQPDEGAGHGRRHPAEGVAAPRVLGLDDRVMTEEGTTRLASCRAADSALTTGGRLVRGGGPTRRRWCQDLVQDLRATRPGPGPRRHGPACRDPLITPMTGDHIRGSTRMDRPEHQSAVVRPSHPFGQKAWHGGDDLGTSRSPDRRCVGPGRVAAGPGDGDLDQVRCRRDRADPGAEGADVDLGIAVHREHGLDPTQKTGLTASTAPPGTAPRRVRTTTAPDPAAVPRGRADSGPVPPPARRWYGRHVCRRGRRQDCASE